MNTTRFLLVLAVATLALPGCGGGRVISVNGTEVYESQWNRTLDELGPTAAFDLSCDRGALQFTLIRRQGRVPTDVGVEGCGARRRYSRIGATWFTANQAAEAGAEQARLDAEAAAAAQQRQQQQQQQRLQQQQRQQQSFGTSRGY